MVLTHIAQGDRKFVVKDYPNQFPPPQSLGTHASGPYTRIWAPGRRYWAHRSAPRRAIGALSSHDGRRNATMIFHRISTYRVLRWQYNPYRACAAPICGRHAWGTCWCPTYSNMGALVPVLTVLGAAPERLGKP